VRIAKALWIVWAIVAWNVVFDHVIVVAGREYVTAASLAARGPGPYARMDDWMRPAIAHALWLATAAAAVILVVGFAAIRRAAAIGSPANSPADARSHDRTSAIDNPVDAGSHGKTEESEGVA
jgi:hypothetical protein